MEIISGKPYIDNDNIREFDVTRDDYVWHRDAEDRIVEIIEGNGWRFQYEDDFPFLLTKGMRVYIKEGGYHRLLKGIDNLKIKINK